MGTAGPIRRYRLRRQDRSCRSCGSCWTRRSSRVQLEDPSPRCASAIRSAHRRARQADAKPPGSIPASTISPPSPRSSPRSRAQSALLACSPGTWQGAAMKLRRAGLDFRPFCSRGVWLDSHRRSGPARDRCQARRGAHRRRFSGADIRVVGDRRRHRLRAGRWAHARWASRRASMTPRRCAPRARRTVFETRDTRAVLRRPVLVNELRAESAGRRS